MAFCSTCGKELPEGSAFCPSCGAPVSQQSGAARQPMSGMDSLINEKRAQGHWLRRLIAFVIDVVIVRVVLVVIGLAFAVPAFLLGGFAAVVSIFAGVSSFVAGIVLVIYFALIEAASGASVGKRLLGLRVSTMEGQRPNFGQALIRNASKLYWILLLVDVIAGLAMSKKYSQKFSDRLAATEVVASERPQPS